MGCGQMTSKHDVNLLLDELVVLVRLRIVVHVPVGIVDDLSAANRSRSGAQNRSVVEENHSDDGALLSIFFGQKSDEA